MTKVTLFYNNKHVYRFRVDGHAGYGEHGEDIVCAAISILAINTVNAIETFTSEPAKMIEFNEKNGVIDAEFPNVKSGEDAHDTNLIINTMVLGLETIKETYGEKYIKISNK